MRAVFQRVKRARVVVDGEQVSAIGPGALVLLGVGKDDTEKDVTYMAGKIAGLRVFSDNEGKMNLSLQDVSGEVLVVSQFTLYGDVKKGKRPGFDGAAPPDKGEELYLRVVEELRQLGLAVQTGVFGANMQVELVNDGPVTILISSKKEF
ncbi:MAG: D-aminoacyl-tRNA deacylase [Bacillota bacterium]|nr:D-tyrosyl-tRNA(Tyr) deacylase [Candidatus Fermentithermobacillaceae bacterium]HAF67231.1 D-tyrosyl-tRNA(Tyr) deacylase [Clostridiales bacterium UBA9857]HOA71024.1 D-aminoacyl-tRNA deacylase [Bacillota bacterium]HOP70364.1 D-aminoacyl-tRNA deacylase [Bacillota bacterium]HPT36370.1 D-aminoacyl-tRNA deacylase [Bacillota bacterium]